MEDHSTGVLGGTDKLDAHALQGEPNLGKITPAVGWHAFLSLIASQSSLIYSRCRR